MDISSKAWEKLESLHWKLGRFVWNVQQKTQNVAVYFACQMEPLNFIVDRMTYNAANVM